MTDNRVPWAFATCRGVGKAQFFGLLFLFALYLFGGSPVGGTFHGLVAILLEGLYLGGEPAEHIHDAGIFFRVGGQLAGGVGLQEAEGELGGSDLEADLGKLGGVVFAEEIGEMILKGGQMKLALLLGAPFLIA